MATRRGVRPRRLWIWLACIALVVLGVAAGAVVWWNHANRTTPVSLADILRREQSADGGTDRLGTYRYRTSGTESVDALGGITHTYPDRTSISVRQTNARCVWMRWDALEQRYEEWVLCRAGAEGAWTRERSVTFHSFTGQDERRVYECTAGGRELVEPTRTDRFETRCRSEATNQSGASTIRLVGIVRGEETLRIGGEVQRVLHVSYREQVRGDTRGSARVERWYLLEHLPVLAREQRTSETKSETAIGTVTYRESYDLRLVGTDPIR